MQITTPGIVLHTVKFGENKIILKVFTKYHGLKSFIINRTSKKNKFAYFQYLAVIEVVYLQKNNAGIINPKELRNLFLSQTLYDNIIKSSVMIFLSEILHKSIKEDVPNPEMYEFIVNSLHHLDVADKNIAVFPLLFLLELAKYLGFAPLNNHNEFNLFFDLYDGRFIPYIPQHLQNLDEKQSLYLHELINCKNNYNTNLSIPAKERLEILKSLIIFFQLHQPNMGNVNAIEILHDVFYS